MPGRLRPIEKFAEAVAKCSAESSVFGRCIAQDFNGVYKDKCQKEFLKLKECYTAAAKRK